MRFPATGPKSTRSIEIELKLMVATGIRVGELCSISTSDVWQGWAALSIRGKGSRDRLVQRLLGHSLIATTDIYAHVSDDGLHKSLAPANILGCLAA